MSLAVAPQLAETAILEGGVLDWLAERFSLDLRLLELWREQGGDIDHPGWQYQFGRWRAEDGRAAGLPSRREAIEQAIGEAGEADMLRRVRRIFALNDGEAALFEACLAVHAAPMLAGQIGALYDERGAALPSERLLADLAGRHFEPLARPSSPLLFWSLIRAGPIDSRLGQTYAVDPVIAAAVAGKPGLDERLAGYAGTLNQPLIEVEEWGLDEVAAHLADRLSDGHAVRAEIVAPAGKGKSLFAGGLAKRLGVHLLALHPPSGSGDEFARRAHRIALLTGQALLWPNASEAAATEVKGVPLQLVCRQPHETLPPSSVYRTERFVVPEPSLVSRRQAWKHLAGDCAMPSPYRLAGLGMGELVRIAGAKPVSVAECEQRISAAVGERIGASCNRLSTPYEWDDLVLAPRQREALDQLLREIELRDALLADAGTRARYGGVGQSAMFWGDPGTGKTMTAQIIARQLGTDCIRVDTGTIISKFIGETQSRLRDLFLNLAGSRVVLLFDEADTLFAKRTDIQDAHDRHANADTNYLLQQIERFDGLAILATNKKDNIDPAFIRRMRHIVDFSLPGAVERTRLWERHLADLSRTGRRHNAHGKLAARLARVEMSASQIKSAALTAAYARIETDAASLATEALVDGIARELGKEGRGLDRIAREELLANA